MAGYGKVVVLLGGNGTPEDRECSLESGGSVLQEMLRLGINATGFDPVKRPLSDLEKAKPDRIFNALFSLDGEDGRLQGWLEYLGVPYTGSGTCASAICFDKVKCKKILTGSEVPTAPFVYMNAETWKEFDLENVLEKLGGTAFIKPAREASTMGASRACSVEELEAGIKLALERDADVIVEKYLPGKEFTVGVIDGEVLPPCELLQQDGHEFYSAELKQKYRADAVPAERRYVCPARSLTPGEDARLRGLVLRGCRALGVEGYTRADVRQDGRGEFYILEYNTGCILTESGTFAACARAAGMTYGDMILRLLNTASVGKH